MAKYDFIGVEQTEDGWLYIVEGERNGKPCEDVIDNVQPTKEDAEREGKAHKAFMLREFGADRREQAMEAGMLHGIDAYNDVMGY